MRFLTIPSFVQVAMSVSVVAALGWLATTSVLVYLRGGAIVERDAQIAEVSEAYRSLSTDFTTLEAEIEKRAKLLEQRQALLEQLLANTPNVTPISDLKTAKPTLKKAALTDGAEKSDDADVAPSAPARQGDTSEAAPKEEQAEQDKSDEGAEKGPSEDGNDQISAAALALAFDPSVIMPGAMGASARRDALLARLVDLEARQRGSVAQLDALLMDAITKLDATLKPTKLTSADLLRLSASSAGAVGGPFVPDVSGADANGSDAGFTPTGTGIDALSPLPAVFKNGDGKPFDALAIGLQEHRLMVEQLDHVPFGAPADKYYISSRFGRRIDPFRKTWSRHSGLDLAGWPGNKILATAPGVVVAAKWYGPYGRMVEIDHGNGYRTRFGHMSKLRVKKGDTVQSGHHIGDMGKSGRATDTHLHYEVWLDGKLVDPLPYVKEADRVFQVKKQLSIAGPRIGGETVELATSR